MNIKAELATTAAAGAMLGDGNRDQWAELLEKHGGYQVRLAISKVRKSTGARQAKLEDVAKELKHSFKGTTLAKPAPVPSAPTKPTPAKAEPERKLPPAATPASPPAGAAEADEVLDGDDQVEDGMPPPAAAVPGAAGITAAVEAITPGRAQAWLLKSQGNRELRKQHIEWLGAQMREGSWEVTGEAIIFAEDGRLLNGHHRLGAVKASGCTVSMLVVYGIPLSAWGKLDCGITRAIHDRLQLLSAPKDNRRAIEILQNLRRIEHGHRGKLTPETVRQDWSELEVHIRALLACFPMSIKGLTRTPVLAALVRYHQRHGEAKALDLAAALLTGANLAVDAPALLLRNWLTIEATTFTGSQQGADEIYWRTVAVCKGHRDGLRFASLVRASSWGGESNNLKASA